MARDWFDDYGDPENRAAAVKRELARIGLSLDTTAVINPAPETGTDVAALMDTSARDGFFDAGGGIMVSPTLAELLHWHPPLPNPDHTEGGKNEVADPDGYEGMRR